MKKVPFYELLIMIILLGGFLFTLIWESMSRYVLPYIVYMVPLAAIGWYSLHEWWATFLKKLKSLKNAVKNRALISIIAASIVMLLAQLTMQSMANYVYPNFYGNTKDPK